MTCGEKGHLGKDGQPCGQNIGPKVDGCIWHTSDAETRSRFALKGNIASRMRRYLPEDRRPPDFSSTAAIVEWAQEMAKIVLAGKIDPRALRAALDCAELCVRSRRADAEQRLLEELMKLEHGGAATLLISRLSGGDEVRRPLPGRRVIGAIAGHAEAVS